MRTLEQLIKLNAWNLISMNFTLTEAFMESNSDKLDWILLCKYQHLSEAIIEKHKDKVNWHRISQFQTLSEAFIEKYIKELTAYGWDYICKNQRLSEAFIEKYADDVVWEYIGECQPLSEAFIEKYIKKLNIAAIARCQIVSDDFCKKHFNSYAKKMQSLKHSKKTLVEKRAEMEEYAKKWGLKFDGEFLYAFRNHDEFGRGSFSPNSYYEKGKTYRDWHCDMDVNVENSFGLGIWPEGNTPVKVAVEDWGCAVNYNYDTFYKGRVWAFTVL